MLVSNGLAVKRGDLMDLSNSYAYKELKTIDMVIAKNIASISTIGRGLASQNILAQLRNYVEALQVLYLGLYTNTNPVYNYDSIQAAIEYIKGHPKPEDLNYLHKQLQMTESHYTQDESESEGLLLRYLEYLINIKNDLKSKGISILENIKDFPVDLDPKLLRYYSSIEDELKNYDYYSKPPGKKYRRCYVYSKQPIIFDGQVLYEVVLTPAIDNVSKHKRIVAFTNFNFKTNYSINVDIINVDVAIDDKKFPISLIAAWEYSVRPCELKNFAKILGNHISISSGSSEYRKITQWLMDNNGSFLNIIDKEDDEYFKIAFTDTGEYVLKSFGQSLDEARTLINKGSKGATILRYLLGTLNNIVLKDQYDFENGNLAGLWLKNGCIPFDEMPFATSLVLHNPRGNQLYDCIDVSNRKHELLANEIRNNAEENKILFTKVKDIKIKYSDLHELAKKFNSKLYHTHQGRRIEEYKGHFYIQQYEDNTVQIIEKLMDLSKNGIAGYQEDVDRWLENKPIRVEADDPLKVQALRKLFVNGVVANVYGAAGTGKSTFINMIANYFSGEDKLFLANTNPAVDNLRRKVNADGCKFLTVAKAKYNHPSCAVLFIDECSTISNEDMVSILNNVSFDKLVLVGDIYQIDSIKYGNWFELSKYFLPKTSVYELTTPYRTNDEGLLKVWTAVRNFEQDIISLLTAYNMCSQIDETLFDLSDDSIILCLKYDGLYGVNNLNRFLQSKNKNQSHTIGLNEFKVGDPILFDDSNRFAPLLYNNLKGVITKIEESEESIEFYIAVDIEADEDEINQYIDLLFVREDNKGNKIISFTVDKELETDNDDYQRNNLPFQLAYAISIHKSQGLEYDNVKIVIADDSSERITHDIFYTAITRARKNLMIYWSPEAMNKVVSSFEPSNSLKDAHLLAGKHNWKIIKK